jgi:hypothetical protein
MTTVALGINGRTWMEIDGPDEIGLHRMDGERLFSLVLWRLPPGSDFERSDPVKNSNEYLQCAGSADRMTLELRRREGAGFAQYCIGRLPSPNATSASRVQISWAGHEVTVTPEEAFSAADAELVFLEYFVSGTIPAYCSLRLLALPI